MVLKAMCFLTGPTHVVVDLWQTWSCYIMERVKWIDRYSYKKASIPIIWALKKKKLAYSEKLKKDKWCLLLCSRHKATGLYDWITHGLTAVCVPVQRCSSWECHIHFCFRHIFGYGTCNGFDVWLDWDICYVMLLYCFGCQSQYSRAASVPKWWH